VSGLCDGVDAVVADTTVAAAAVVAVVAIGAVSGADTVVGETRASERSHHLERMCW
jgi:hypothetical protein